MFDIISFAGGAGIGAGMTWILECWVGLFLKQLGAEHSKEFTQSTTTNNSKFFTRIGIYVVMSIATALLCVWRQWTSELLNDLILVSALVGIAWIDRKTLLIEGRMVSLALLLRILWLSFFASHQIFDALAGLLIGAGILYFIGFLYKSIVGSNNEFQLKKVFWHNTRIIHSLFFIIAAIQHNNPTMCVLLLFSDIVFSIIYRVFIGHFN